ncbi:MAG: type II toxin-antitoxin system Phd/YefM family antitoxin [Candidatus Aminicenantes bacterium]|nr:type II toxin-antitoxin system Phd/YefM family antitoxin [Candidatus Aminicenantes bacterium]
MTYSITLTEARTKLPDIINRILTDKDKVYISRKGKKVAVLMPVDDIEESKEEGLILAQRGLADLGDEIEEMERVIYQARFDRI